eukprot:3847413-Rhodomonas_salina.1
MLLEEAEMFVPGSNERTNSLEQIRSILLDRGTSMRKNQGMGESGSFGASRKGAAGGAGSSFLHGMSPDNDGGGLLHDDMYYEGAGAMSSIPESSPPENWDTPGHLGQYGVSSSCCITLHSADRQSDGLRTCYLLQLVIVQSQQQTHKHSTLSLPCVSPADAWKGSPRTDMIPSINVPSKSVKHKTQLKTRLLQCIYSCVCEQDGGAEYDDIEGTFRMDDVGEPNMPAPAFPHVHIRSHAITSSSSHKHVLFPACFLPSSNPWFLPSCSPLTSCFSRSRL